MSKLIKIFNNSRINLFCFLFRNQNMNLFNMLNKLYKILRKKKVVYGRKTYIRADSFY